MPKAKDDNNLVATTGLDYLGVDGKFRRVEAGGTVKASSMDPKALRWMVDGGFLVADQGDPQEGGD